MAAKPVVVVKANTTTTPWTLGDCPFCHRVLLTLEAKHVPYETELVDLANKPEWLASASGGKVPVIRLGGAGCTDWLPDSDKIVVYIEEKNPEPSMKSDTPPEVGARMFPAFKDFLYAAAGSAEEGDKRAAFVAELQGVEDYLKGKGPLFGGAAMDAHDAAIAPRLYHALTALSHLKGWSLPAEFPSVAQYMRHIKTLPAWKACDYGEDIIRHNWAKNVAAGIRH